VTANSRPRGPVSQNHYSYSVYADTAMADRFNAVRFGGPIGALLAESQERVLLDYIGPLEARTVIDVGTGTGRAALALAARGARVTGLDASLQMLDVAREEAQARDMDITFVQGDAHALPFAAGSFDVAVALRLLMHTPDWARCVGELCRVARQCVILDYPALLSGAALQSCYRRVAARFGGHVEAYRVLPEYVMRRELGRHGFQLAAARRQFVLPIALHKRIGWRRGTELIESALARVGLLHLLGSPVTIRAVR
jgi:SAM-dependent methyltransferase